MQVQRVQNNNYNTQFRGKLDKSVEEFVLDSVKRDCRNYVSNLKIPASTKVLNKIKADWMGALDILRKKVALTHKDTTVKVVGDYGGDLYPGYGNKRWNLVADNSKLNKRHNIKYLSFYQSLGNFKKLIKDMKPHEVDRVFSAQEKKDILSHSIEYRWHRDEEINQELNNLIEYQKEIGENVSKELIKNVNNNRAKIKAEQLKKEQQKQINKKNSDILNQFFEENFKE